MSINKLNKNVANKHYKFATDELISEVLLKNIQKINAISDVEYKKMTACNRIMIPRNTKATKARIK